MSRKYLLLFVLLCALWGFSFVTLKVALRHVDPIFLASIRFWLPAILVLWFTALIGRPWLPKRSDLAGLALLGVVNTGLLAMFLNLGQKEISAALGSIPGRSDRRAGAPPSGPRTRTPTGRRAG